MLTVVPPPAPSSAEATQQERRAWEHVARGCEAALRELDPQHPHRAEFVEMWTDCRLAAKVHGSTVREVK